MVFVGCAQKAEANVEVNYGLVVCALVYFNAQHEPSKYPRLTCSVKMLFKLRAKILKIEQQVINNAV